MNSEWRQRYETAIDVAQRAAKVALTPHNAADTDPDQISKYVAQQIERFEAGGALENVVDRRRGY